MKKVTAMKQLVSEKRTQVYFPMETYRKIEKRAREESKSSAQVIREAVESFLEQKQVDWDNDPFFKAVGIFESESGNLSEKHDKYLYGKKKRRARK